MNSKPSVAVHASVFIAIHWSEQNAEFKNALGFRETYVRRKHLNGEAEGMLKRKFSLVEKCNDDLQKGRQKSVSVKFSSRKRGTLVMKNNVVRVHLHG